MNTISKAYGILLLGLCLLIGGSSIAQSVVATADRDSILIGEALNIQLQVEVDATDKLDWVQLKETYGEHIELLEYSKIDTLSPTQYQQSIAITSFDSGFFVLPPLAVNINDSVFETEPILFYSTTVEVDTSQAIKDIKEIIEVPYTFMDWLEDNWIYVSIGAAALLLVVVLIILLRRKPTAEPYQPPAPVVPPHEIALKALQELSEQKRWQNGDIKGYHYELTLILRQYLEKRFKIAAVEQTTEETMQSLRFSAMKQEEQDALRQVLMLSDMVKFAKEKPIGSLNEQSLSFAIQIIERNKVETQPVNTNANPA